MPPAAAWLIGVPICLSAAVLAVPCPGCGLTRATVALASGDLAAALALNPLAAVVCPLFAAALAYGTYRYVRHGNVRADSWGAGYMLAISMAALTIVWLVRWFGYFGGPVAV